MAKFFDARSGIGYENFIGILQRSFGEQSANGWSYDAATIGFGLIGNYDHVEGRAVRLQAVQNRAVVKRGGADEVDPRQGFISCPGTDQLGVSGRCDAGYR